VDQQIEPVRIRIIVYNGIELLFKQRNQLPNSLSKLLQQSLILLTIINLLPFAFSVMGLLFRSTPNVLANTRPNPGPPFS
jgi:hypothetical protein